IVVTGAASGIGLALADRLLAAGDAVIGLDRSPCPDRITTSVQVDLGDADAVRAAVASLDGPVHGIANVAGVPGTAPPEVVLAVNLLGARVLTEALLPRLPSRGGGCRACRAGRRGATAASPAAGR